MPPQFPQPDVTPINDKEYILVEDYIYVYTVSGLDYKIVVPKGFVTDLASIPRLAWTLTGLIPDGLHRAAAVVHDYLYQWRGRLPMGQVFIWTDSVWVAPGQDPLKPTETILFTRQECDKIFLQAMNDAGEIGWRARVMYWAVEHFGQFAWNS